MKFYVATGFANAALARAIADKLEAQGHELTYDWTVHANPVHSSRPQMKPHRVAIAEAQGLLDAEVIIAFLPGAADGTHFELGFAAANGKAILLIGFAENLMPKFAFCEPHVSDCKNPFYHLPGIEHYIISDEMRHQPTAMAEVVLAYFMSWQAGLAKHAVAASGA